MRRIAQIVLVCAVAAAALASCASAKVLVNPAAKFPVEVTDKAPAFLFPVNLSHLGAAGDANVMGVSVSAGIISKFGKTVVSGQQLFDLVGNLSYELAETIDSQAKAGEWKMTGSAETIASGLATLMEKILATLAELKLVEPGYKFQYIIAVHSHGQAATVPGSLTVNSWGGLYNVDTKEILSYINADNTIANQEAAVLGQLPGIYNGIIEKLLAGK